MIVAHNLMAMNAARQYNMVTGYKAKSSEKLSSGYRINRAADDAAGLSISEKMRWQIRGLNRGSQNIQDGISLVQTADGALNEIHSMIHRIKELAVQASNGTNSDADREALQNEVAQIKKEITRTFNTTEFNGMPLFRCPYVLGVSDDPEPNDIKMFNKNTSGNQVTGSGGLIFNNKRYTWSELGASVSNGVFTDDFTYKQEDNGETIELSANKGDTVADIIRYYQVTSDSEGVYVNNVPAARWQETSALGKWANVDAIHVDDTSYSFTYHGVDVSFMADDGDDRETVINRLNPDPLSEERTMYFTSKAISGVTYESAVVSQAGTMVLDVTESNKNSISGFTYKISADDTGVTIAQTNGNDGITHKKIAWSEFKNTKTGEEFRFTDWGLEDDSNPQTFSNAATYEYKDTPTTDMETALSFTFTVKDEASKQGIINGLNNITLTPSAVSAPLKEGGKTDMLGVLLGYHSDFSFEFQRDELERTFDDAITPISGTVTRTRVDTGTVGSYVKTHTMKELYVKKITEVRNDIGELISSNKEYVSLSNQNTSDGAETTDPHTGETTKWYYQTNDEGDFEYYYDNGTDTVSADSYISDGIYGRDDNGSTIGNDDNHLAYSSSSIGSSGQKYIMTDTGWSLDKVFNTFKNVYTYTNPSGEMVFEGTGEIFWGVYAADEESDEIHVDIRSGVKDWKGRDVDTYSESSAAHFYINDSNGRRIGYGTAFSNDWVKLLYNGTSTSQYISMSYSGSSDSSDGSGSKYSVVHTTITPTDEATRKYTKYSTSRGASYRTDYESITAPPPQKSLNIQAGPKAEQCIELTWDGMALSTISLGGANVSTENRAKHTLDLADRAVEIVSVARSKFGAYQNRLEHAMDSVNCTSENLTAAESRIRDTDMALEMVAYGRQKILEQVANAMLSQANQNTSMVLQLLG